jgi:meso-butanediol dehydrogenase/(S,S)-butanediol dehydrogenase/diacetyl reductase
LEDQTAPIDAAAYPPPQSRDRLRLRRSTLTRNNPCLSKSWRLIKKEIIMRFQDKIVIVTGGGSGIGAATVRRFHQEGAITVISDRSAERGEAFAAELGNDRAHYRRADVSNPSEIADLVENVVATFGRLDILINNAGIGNLAAAADIELEDWHRVIDVDLNGVFYGCRAALPIMRAQGGGVIVNTASASGLAGDFGFAAYNAAKGAVVNFTRAAAVDHAADGIRVNAVCPGPVGKTAIMDSIGGIPGAIAAWQERVPMGRFAEPEEIANVIAFLASNEASFMTGANVTVDGGLTAHTGQPNLPLILAQRR